MRRFLAAAGLALAQACVFAQDDAVVVTATRVPQPSLEVPASIDRLYAEEIREGRAQVNLSESLGRVPGIVVQNRQNYAQDLQISSRGFGARASFGVRGIRLIADGIPATMPDGQGQAATVALGSASRIEVLRGPFSSLYGNAAGGVINVETEDGPEAPAGGFDFSLGSYKTWRGALKYGGQWGRLNAIADVSRFETGGYRRHSAATRDHLNAKLKYGLTESASLTAVFNSLRQPQTQDPLGLTRAQFDADPRQAVAPAFTFNTRKSVFQDQFGLAFTQRWPGVRVQATVYGGERWVEQYLSIPLATQAAATHSGGVVQLDRGYGGGALRLFSEGTVRFSAGIEYERMDERRRGFINANGVAGALKRDENDVVSSTDLYAQGEWKLTERWSVHGGARASRVKFRSSDYFIVAGNPDDSGARAYSATTPVAGVVYKVQNNISLYGNLGRGFETPTFAELAHQNTGSGLNFALQASRSRYAEAGIKAILPKLARINAAAFDIRTRDEIVVEAAAGGRTTFKNAGRTGRKGIELAAETLFSQALDIQFAYTRLEAVFKDSFTSSGGSIPSGNLLPGVPRGQAYAQLRYRSRAYYAQLEALRRSRVAVNDANSEFADAYNTLSLAGGLVQQGARWRVSEFVRIDNLTDRNYAGSVIVNESNGRFYEPAPGRTITVGIQASLSL